jgi:ABC-type sugar transport system ATPase subunit
LVNPDPANNPSQSKRPRASGGDVPLLRLLRIEKAFPGVLACDRADLEVRAGEIHALVGENGAGKSTLIKVATGAHQPDGGTIEMNGARVAFAGPQAAACAGIAAIYQELNLVPALSVRDNLFLGRRGGRAGIIRQAHERRLAVAVLRRLGADIDPEIPCGRLDIAHQQLVEIGRALLCQARLLIMDEPTAALTYREVASLFAILEELREQGTGILLISHRLDEVFRITERLTVMRDGATLGTWPTCDLSRGQLIELMVGRPLDQEFPKVKAPLGRPLLAVDDLSGQKAPCISFAVRQGEVLGLAGLVGAGRTRVARLIYGADPRRSGRIILNGREVTISCPRDAIGHGICLLTEDRKAQGLVQCMSVLDNFALPNLAAFSRRGWIDKRRQETAFETYRASLKIRLTDPRQPASQLSGGNQQKLLLARWLQANSQVVIFDEPTRGIDVGAKHEIYQLINGLTAQGKAVVMISSELPEILGMSDRVLVMHEGRISGEIADPAGTTQQQILQMAVGRT